jgi:3-oxoacyl-[acyl-carrier protein] reductase
MYGKPAKAGCVSAYILVRIAYSSVVKSLRSATIRLSDSIAKDAEMPGLDLGLEGRTALVCGSSAGLGRACAQALAAAGASVVLNGRQEGPLREAAKVIGDTHAEVRFVVGDVTTAEGRKSILAACPSPDILVNNAAGPPTGDFRDFDEVAWQNALRVSMVSPIMLIRSVIDQMIDQKWGRIINITSSAVKSPLPLLGLSNGARSGLTGFVAGLAREVAIHGVTINNLLPGRMQTGRLDAYIGNIAASRGVSFDEAAADMSATNPMQRFGKPEELGAFCAFLCSQQAAYMTGQNILIDGGEFTGL